MEAPEAREHLELIDRILAAGTKPASTPLFGPLLVMFGLGAAALDAGTQLNAQNRGSALLIAGVVVVILSYVYLLRALTANRRTAGRMPHSEVFIGRTMSAMWIAIFVASFAQPHLFPGWSAAAIWSLGAAIQMLIVGFFGDRRATIAGFVLLASIVGANFVATPGYVLGAGFIAGYFVPGLLYIARPAIAEDRERTTSL